MCLEGRADPKTCCCLQHFVSCHTDNTGTSATQRLHGRKLLLHFAPDVLQRKVLGRVQEKHGEGGGTAICISYLSFTKVQETWAEAMPAGWWVWCPCVQLLPALGSAPCSSSGAEGSPCLLWTAHLDAAAPTLALPAAP